MRKLLAVFIVCVWPTLAQAWGSDGHRAIANAAEQTLSERGRQALSDLIGDRSLADVSTALDDRRKQPEWAWSRQLHYVNVDPTADRFDASRDCPDDRCAVVALQHFAHRLADRSASRSEREEALEFVVHLVADIHQPLHVAYAHDRGGNDVTLSLDGHSTTLHELWDHTIARSVLQDALRPISGDPDPTVWADESLSATRTSVYGLPDGSVVPSWYLDRADNVATERMSLAAGRLSDLLDTALLGRPIPFEDPHANYERDTNSSPSGWVVLLLIVAAVSMGGVTLRLSRRSIARFARLASLFRSYLPLTTAAAVATLLPVSLDLALPLLYRHAFDVVLPTSDVPGMGVLVAIGGAVVLVSAIGVWISARALSRLGAHVQRDVQIAMCTSLQTASLRALDGTPRATLLSPFQADLPIIHNLVVTALPNLLRGAVVAGSALGLMLWMDWRVTVVALMVLPVGVIGPRYFAPKTGRASKQSLTAQTTAAAGVLDLVHGMQVIRAFGLGQRWHDQLSAEATITGKAVQTHAFFAIMMRGSAGIGMSVLMILVLAAAGTVAIYSGVTTGALSGIFVLMLSVGGALRTITSTLPHLLSAEVAYTRIQEVLDLEPSSTIGGLSAPPLPLSSAIQLREVCFSYDGVNQHLDHVNIHIPAGERTAIVGPSGSGKSTLLHLLTRQASPGSGRLMWDGNDLSDGFVDETLAATGLVPQRPTLFATSLLDNIRLGRLDATDEDVFDAARRARIHSAIVALPHGYSTVAGDGGTGLSGGQQQRVAIARAILRNPTLLLLDEATAALDPATAAEVMEILHAATPHQTIVAVTHQLSAITDFDNIVVMHEGRAIDAGSHADLMHRSDVYRRLVQAQDGMQLAGDGRSGVVTPERLRQSPLLMGAPDEVLGMLARHAGVETHRDQQVLFHAGDTGDRLLLLARGQLDVLDEDGTIETTVDPGSFVGEMAILGDGRRTATVVARGFTSLFSLSRRTLVEAATMWPELESRLKRTARARGDHRAPDGRWRRLDTAVESTTHC